jgi:hypothetical protein
LVIQQLTLLFFILVRSGLWIEKRKGKISFSILFLFFY